MCQDITVQLDASGNATITAADVDNGSSDNCGSTTMTVSPSSFDCSDIGTNTVTLTITDAGGNSSNCTATVTVEDTMTPVAMCQDITVQLDASGNATITAADVDNGSSDNCSSTTMTVSPSSFDCSDIGTNTVTLTVTDAGGNSSSCTATVTVEDTLAPVAMCQDITVQLDASGNATITAADVDGGSTDNCGVASSSIDISSFDCSDIGTNNVTLTITDTDGNTSSCVAIVTVQDLLPPDITCPANQTVVVPVGQMYTLPDYFGTGEASATDNCTDPVTNTTQDPVPGTQLPDGVHTISLTAVDDSGNTAVCTFELIVEIELSVGEQGLQQLALFPNPAKERVILDNPQSLSLEGLKIYDLRGRLIKRLDLRNMGTRKTIDVSEMASASYFIVIESQYGQVIKRIIKE